MAENSCKVLIANYVRITNIENKVDDRVYETSIQVLCGYDPQGVNVKLVKGRNKFMTMFYAVLEKMLYCLGFYWSHQHIFLLQFLFASRVVFQGHGKENGFADKNEERTNENNAENGQEEDLVEFLVTKTTPLSKKREMHVLHTEDEVLFIRFATKDCKFT